MYVSSAAKSEDFEASYNSIVLAQFGALFGRGEILSIVRQLRGCSVRLFVNRVPQKTVLLIDYENIQGFDLTVIQEEDIWIKIFVGQNQTKIPIELVQSTHSMGPRVEWIRMEGMGRNALDFHIAFYLGRLSQNMGEASFVIMSKDKGFDPLIEHLNKEHIRCQRIQELTMISESALIETTEAG